MNIYSFLFLASSLLAAIIYHVLPKKLRSGWLLLISIGFLITWSWKFVIVLFVFGIINFWFGIRLENSEHLRKWLVSGIAFNIFFLLLIKYNQFYLSSLEILLKKMNWLSNSDALTILVPVGLSFLMVQAISYLLDVSKKRMKAETDPVKFGIYILYFPKLLSGPVERARQFLPRLDHPLTVNRQLVERSLSLLLIGLFRKCAIANTLFTMIPEDAFTAPQGYAGQHLLFWLLAYSFALFNDFAGYTCIIRGVSLWFGIELTNNFNLPYLSRNFTEFWNRWHISLSSWLRDYIFFPLQRSLMRRYPQRNHFLNLVVPPMVTMLASGLWHGLSWNLLVWGGLHGLYLVMERISGFRKPAIAPDEQPRWKQRLSILITFTLATLAWIPFKMSLPLALSYFTGLFKWVKPDFFLLKRYLTGNAEVLSWSPLNFPNPLLLLMIALAIGFDLLMNSKGNEKEISSLPKWLQIVLLVVILLSLLLTAFTDTTAPFVYQGF